MVDKPGLSIMEMDDILTKDKDSGKSVFMSIYEVFQEHAYDLLDSKRSKIQVLEDARGRINLKGLSQVSVESLSQFEEYRSRSLSGKTNQKIPVEVRKRSHKVIVVYLSSMNEPSSINRGGKMNFVDLAGYEDTRTKISEGNNLLENVKINKSLHATMNVIYVLNINDSRVPFRESKLTRMLQESLGGSNPVLMLACMWFTIGSSALVSLALFGAFVSRAGVSTLNVLSPKVFIGLIVETMLPHWFSAMTMKSVGSAAPKMVEEVRRQFNTIPGIMLGTTKPNYATCVKISTVAFIKEMIPPGVLVMLTPLINGIFFGVETLSGVLDSC